MSSKHNRFVMNALKKLTRRYDIEAVKEYSKKYSLTIQYRFAKWIHRNKFLT